MGDVGTCTPQDCPKRQGLRFPRIGARTPKCGHSLVLLLVTTIVVGLPYSSASVQKHDRVIRAAGEELDTTVVPSLKPRSFLTPSWMVGLVGTLTGFIRETDIKQWYVVLDDGANVQQLVNESGVSLGTQVAANTHVATGSEAMARKLAGMDGVRWINERPRSHKMDRGLRIFSPTSSRRAGAEDLSKQPGAVQLRKLIVVLVPLSQQHASARLSAQDFKEVCEREFPAKSWRAAVTVITDSKLLIELLEPERAVPGAVRTSTADVAEWLAGQWHVQWVEPKGMFKPMARYASKIMSLGDFSNRYISDASKQLLTETLTSEVQTASWEIESVGGEGTGRFCFWHNDRMIVGSNGTDPAFLSPVLTVKTMSAGTGYTTNAGLMVTTLQFNSSAPLAPEADWYAGMQVQVGTEYRMVASYTLQSSSSSLSVATITVHPALEGPVLAGTELQVWLVVQPGDTVTVMADAALWRGTLTQDWLPLQRSSRDPHQKLHVQCPMAGGAMMDRIPRLLWDWGIRRIRESCEEGVQQSATAQVPVASTGALTEEAARAECPEVCRSEEARALLEAQEVCVANVSNVRYSGAFGEGGGGGGWWCECTYSAPIRLRLQVTVPEANPLWEAGLSGEGQVVGVADTGVDSGNCLMSEGDGSVAPLQGSVDLGRDKVVGVLRNTNCALCDGCSKEIAGDAWTFFGQDADLVPPGETGPGRPIWAFAWPHRCINANTRTPTGCDVEAVDAMMEPRRYDQLGALLEMGLRVTFPPPFETVPARVKLYVLAREDYEKHKGNVTALDENRNLCMNQGCGEPVETVDYTGSNVLRLRPSRRGYGIVVAVAGENTARVQNQLREGTRGLQFYSAEVQCGDYGDDAAGHGTFCAGVIAGQVVGGPAPGAGVGTRAERVAARNHEGVAKAAKLVVFDLSSGQDGVDNITIPLDLKAGLLEPVRDAGARILSNSWSCLFPQVVCDLTECQYTPEDYCNEYSTTAHEIDDFVWKNPDLLVVVPVGDSAPPSGTASRSSLRSPATCKNCISVGASHPWHAALEHAMQGGHVDAMDAVSAPLAGKRLMCPRNLFPEPSQWPQNIDQEVAEVAEGEEAPLLNGEIRGWPVEPAECCNTDPNHNTDIEVLIQNYQDLVDFNREQNRPATAEEYVKLQNVERAKLFPCRPEPNCCLVPDSFCCLANYQGEDAAAVPANPLRPTSFDINRLVGTSARGPADDGEIPPSDRIKPDMVAPGAFLVAANSLGSSSPQPHCSLPGRTDLPFAQSAAVVAMSGTSVATAVVAGAAALVRQYFSDGWHPTGSPRAEDKLEPSAALLKACLLTSSESTTQDGGSRNRTRSMPNVLEGWGRPSLMRLLYLKNSGMEARRLWVVDETIGFENAGWVHEYEFLVDMSEERVDLAITLTWTDPAPSPGSETVLVNDLDLAASDEGTVGWVNGRVCPVDELNDDPINPYFPDCPLPIPDTANTVEKTDFWIRHKLVCTYGLGTRSEYGACNREGELGKLRGSVKDRSPSTVKVRVIARRIADECVSDGFYQTCSKRRQPYALVVSGPLLARASDGSLLPPIFSGYREGSAPPKDIDAAPISPARRADAPSAGERVTPSGWAVALCVVLCARRTLLRSGE